jgi:hypothetical protein
MTIRANVLIELLRTFPIDATVHGFENGLTVKNPDGTGEVVMLNDMFGIPAKSTLSKAVYPLAS